MVLSLNSLISAQPFYIEFHNETSQDVSIMFEIWYYLNSPPDCNLDDSDGMYEVCIPASSIYYYQTQSTRYIGQVKISCECAPNEDYIEIINCGDEPVEVQCGANDWIMAIAPHGWRVEPYTP